MHIPGTTYGTPGNNNTAVASSRPLVASYMLFQVLSFVVCGNLFVFFFMLTS